MIRFLNRCVLTSCAAAALFAGCGGSPPQMVAPLAGPLDATAKIGAHPAAGSSGNLLYVASQNNGIHILDYPSLHPIGTITAQEVDGYGCPDDASGTVYFQTSTASGPELSEYRTGDTTSIGGVSPPTGYYFGACAVDPTTQNVAVITTKVSQYKTGYIAVYASGSGTPQKYRDPLLEDYNSCTYDSHGNLFVGAFNPKTGFSALAELAKGSSKFANLTLDEHIGTSALQWRGKDLTAGEGPYYERYFSIYRIKVSGTHAKVVGITPLKHATIMAWIQGSTAISLVASRRNEGHLAFYAYPAGGKPTKLFRKLPTGYTWGVIVAHEAAHPQSR